MSTELDDHDLERYSRTILLPEIGRDGQRALRSARIVVVGAGGLGAPVLLALACAGVGVLGIVDSDRVDLGNLQRQFAHRLRDVGRRKTRSAARAVRALNPGVVVREHRLRLTAANAGAIFEDYDVVVDGSDNFATRYLIADAAAARGVPCVWGSVLRFEGQVSVFWPGSGPGYRDLYPEASADGPTCGTAGVFGPLCGQVGAIMAGEVVKIVTGAGDPLTGRIAVVDALRAQWRTFTLTPGSGAGAPADRARNKGAAQSPACAPSAPVRIETITAATLRAEIAATDAAGPLLVDVREPGEPGGIPGAVRVPLSLLRSGTATPPPGPLVLYCAAGVRSETAAAMLAAQGRTVRTLAGGLAAWQHGQ